MPTRVTSGVGQNFATNIRFTFAAASTRSTSAAMKLCVKCYARIELTDIKDYLVNGISFATRDELK